MAFPTVVSFNGQQFPGNNVTHLVDMPVTVNNGELLVVLFVNDGGDSCTTPSGWTRVGIEGGTLVEANVFVKEGDGSEGGTLVNFSTPGGGEEATSHTYLFDNWDGVVIPEQTRTAAGSGTPDPGALSPAWGALDTMWLAVAGRNDAETITGGPAGFTDFVWTESSGLTSGSCEMASARKEENIVTQDPGVFTVNTANEWIAFTVGIKPVDAGGSSPNVNPTGSALQTMASGVPVIPPDDTETVTPVGTPFTILASDVPAVQVVNAGESIAPTGSTFLTLTSDVPFIQITLAPVEVSPVGETTQPLEENEAVDARHPVQIFMGSGDGDAFFVLESGVPVIDGTERDLTLRLDAFNLFAGSALPAPQSGVPLISSASPGNINLTASGSTFPLLQPQITDPPEDQLSVPSFSIDRDLDMGNVVGSEFGLASGVVSFTNLQTGVLGTVLGSTFGLLASSTAKFSQSHPTAPPGTTGGRLIIRAVTHNITHPVTLTTEIQIAVATG